MRTFKFCQYLFNIRLVVASVPVAEWLRRRISVQVKTKKIWSIPFSNPDELNFFFFQTFISFLLDTSYFFIFGVCI